jgi:hypothetical protein
VSFVSDSLQTLSPEKMTIEDEEMFMTVALQMYAGMLSSVLSLNQFCLSDDTLVQLVQIQWAASVSSTRKLTHRLSSIDCCQC